MCCEVRGICRSIWNKSRFACPWQCSAAKVLRRLSGAFLLRHPLTHVRAGREPHLFSPQGFPLHFIEKCVSIKRAIRRSDAVRRWVQDVQNCDRRGSGRNTGKPEPVRPAICAGAGPAGGDQSHHRRCRDRRALYAGDRHYFYGQPKLSGPWMRMWCWSL